MVELNQKVAFLKNLHLFSGLSDAQIALVADRLQEENYVAGDVILEEDESSNRFFYLLYQGEVKVTRRTKDGGEKRLATLVNGDYFGEMSMQQTTERTASVVATKKTVVFALSEDDTLDLGKQFPKFKTNLNLAASSRQLMQKLNFTWLFPKEVVYYVSRKHKMFLWIRLAILFTLSTAIILAFSLFMGFSWLFFGVSVAITLLLIPWFYIDWANDYYVVTNERVVWLEKLVGVFEKRKEIPMSAILSVDFDTTFLGRTVNVGNVILRTYTGQISLSQLEHSEEVAGQIADQWKRLQEQEQQMGREAIKRVVRERIYGIEEEYEEFRSKPAQIKNKTFLEKNFAHFFQQRFEENGVVTYRKFWVYLILKSWKPFTVMFLAMVYLGFYLIARMPEKSKTVNIVTISFLVILIIASFVRWVYQYLDWSNDFFQVTSEQVIDVDRTPFGADQRRSAPLENILSVEFDIKGLLRILFNYGTVYINVGNTTLSFDEVKNPSQVQQEILYRMNKRVKAIRKKEAEYPQEQLTEWLEIYHEVVGENEGKFPSIGYQAQEDIDDAVADDFFAEEPE
jgi:hypothetical protein